jgi:TetR/AcrR family transcriptional regulator, cholesterol catabolism regulator
LEPKERILTAAQELFHRYGIKSVTMDDIARHLGMSKKTIYQHFRDKDELVLCKTNYDLGLRECQMEDIFNSAENAIDELIKAMSYVSQLFQQMNPTVFYDMQKYHSEAWEKFRTFKQENIIKMVERNLLRGISEGLYRKELNVKIVSRIRAEQVEMSMRPDIFPPPEFNITEVQLQMLDHYLHGISTLKGHRLINKYKEITEEE